MLLRHVPPAGEVLLLGGAWSWGVFVLAFVLLSLLFKRIRFIVFFFSY